MARAALDQAWVRGFTPAGDVDYDDIRCMLATVEAVGFLVLAETAALHTTTRRGQQRASSSWCALLAQAPPGWQPGPGTRFKTLPGPARRWSPSRGWSTLTLVQLSSAQDARIDHRHLQPVPITCSCRGAAPPVDEKFGFRARPIGSFHSTPIMRTILPAFPLDSVGHRFQTTELSPGYRNHFS